MPIIIFPFLFNFGLSLVIFPPCLSLFSRLFSFILVYHYSPSSSCLSLFSLFILYLGLSLFSPLYYLSWFITVSPLFRIYLSLSSFPHLFISVYQCFPSLIHLSLSLFFPYLSRFITNSFFSTSVYHHFPPSYLSDCITICLAYFQASISHIYSPLPSHSYLSDISLFPFLKGIENLI